MPRTALAGATLSGRRAKPGYTCRLKEGRQTRGPADGYCCAHTHAAPPAQPARGRVGELGARAHATARGALVRGNRGRGARADRATAEERRTAQPESTGIPRLPPGALGTQRRRA